MVDGCWYGSFKQLARQNQRSTQENAGTRLTVGAYVPQTLSYIVIMHKQVDCDRVFIFVVLDRGGKKVDERSGPWFDMMCTGQPSVSFGPALAVQH